MPMPLCTTVLLGAAAVLGMLIKFTVVIMVIAIAIDSLFHRSLKQAGMLAGISATMICAGFLSFQAMIYPAHLDMDASKEYNTPYLHWVMMGLKGDGATTVRITHLPAPLRTPKSGMLPW